MTPDFGKPAFAFVALCGARFRSRTEAAHARVFRSDYRCQLRYVEAGDPPEAEVRAYFVGQDTVSGNDEVAIVVAFLDWERARDSCRVGSRFELCEGQKVTATGTVYSVATR
jgi:hypothetical protein